MNNFILRLSVTLFLLIAYTGVVTGQESNVKRGWNFGPLPAVSYSTHQGFQYGVLCDIYWFGDGSQFPGYIHKFNVEVSRYTKGSGVYHLFYDSEYLLPGLRSTFDISYLTDKMMDFYGFNGYMSSYDQLREVPFYNFSRNLFRATADFQGEISGNFRWVAGAGLYSYKTENAKNDVNSGDIGLFEKYINQGLISDDEKDGGTRLEIKLGAVYDTRDNEADPWSGVNGTALFLLSPLENSYGKVFLSASGYIPLKDNKLTLALRGVYQGTFFGEQPFYMLQNIATLYFRQITNEGLGGLNSIRGVLRNRVVGAGVALSNIELRYRFASFNLFNQSWYLAINPFFDAGRVVQFYKKELMVSPSGDSIYSGEREELHKSAGIGAKAVMNRNFILSAEWGKPFDKRDGDGALSIGLNFIF